MKPFKPFTKRYPTPYEASGSSSPLWYSIKRASAYIIVLSSYSACSKNLTNSGYVLFILFLKSHIFTKCDLFLFLGKYTPQYIWLKAELAKVNRTETPWLIVLTHAPMYNSYNNHYMEGETMRVVFEPWFVEYKVDVVFNGHVHAYERSVCSTNLKFLITLL